MKINSAINHLIILLLLSVSCMRNTNTNTNENADKIALKISDFTEVQIDSPFEILSGEPKFVLLSPGEDYSYGFSKTLKVEYIKNKIYIQEYSKYKLLVYDDSGNPVLKLDYRGRGPNEYLQITDFDVDTDGNIWIADAQKNKLFKYSDAGIMLESWPYRSEVAKICCLNNNRFLYGIANWDYSEFAGTALAIADSTSNIQSSILSYPERNDPNYGFSSVFSRTGNSVFYNWPVDDNLYEVSYDGELLNTYYFDFGSLSVPEKWRSNLELFESFLPNYLFLVHSSQVTPEYVVTGMSNSVDWFSVIMDREKKEAAYFNENTSGYSLVGQYDSGSVWRIDTNCDLDDIPSYVGEWLNNGGDVLAFIPFE